MLDHFPFGRRSSRLRNRPEVAKDTGSSKNLVMALACSSWMRGGSLTEPLSHPSSSAKM